MTTSSELIAAIAAAWLKRHPDEPGIFETPELRCRVWAVIEEHFGRNKTFYFCMVQRSMTPSRWKWLKAVHEKYCSICHGKLFREPDLEWVLEWLWKHGKELHPPFINRIVSEWLCCAGDPDNTLGAGSTPRLAALACLLAVVEKEDGG